MRELSRSAERSKKDFDGEPVVLVGILRGAVMWMVDIMKNVNLDMVIDFMAVSSYGSSTKSQALSGSTRTWIRTLPERM